MGKRTGPLESMGLNLGFWKDRKVFLTGHTGFKGSWLTLVLHHLGAKVSGYSLAPISNPNLFSSLNKKSVLAEHTEADIRDLENLKKKVSDFKPDVILHLAAQALVRESYVNPIETYSTNVQGTVNVLEAARLEPSVISVLCITTDKVYQNEEWDWPYRENDRLGGYDPYSSSKACCEIAIDSYRNSFFNKTDKVLISARAGNVIGGGDWSKDRLLPDILEALNMKQKVLVRNPDSVRPWQHVLDPLYAYLLLVQKSFENPEIGSSWNIGPNEEGFQSVKWIVDFISKKSNIGSLLEEQRGSHPKETKLLKLDCSKMKTLGWKPIWNLEQSLERVLEWNSAYQTSKSALEISQRQIAAFFESANVINS